MPAPDPAQPFWQMEGISKRYGGVTALDNVDFTCRRGRIHAVLGENGAGKSTLIKIMAGVVQPDSGTMRLEGRSVTFAAPVDAMRQGVVSIFQELSLIPDLSVADNLSIVDPPRRFGFIDRAAQRRRAEDLLARVGCDDVHPLELVRNLPLSRRQMVEIAGALGRSPKMLILDEATSALTVADVEKIYEILRRLRGEGLAIVYISHRMHEIAALADDCSVFRNGQHIETFAKGAKTDNEIVELMIGREYRHVFPPKPARNASPEPMLEVEKLSWGDRLTDISLKVDRGEVVGIGGLDGQGQRELLLALFGVLSGVSGTVKVAGQAARLTSPRHAKSPGVGMALIPEDRKTEGLMLPMSVRDNISLAAVEKFTHGLLIDRSAERRAVEDMVQRLAIRAGSADAAVGTLSGGNQQKVVIAKWLMTEARLILLNDPTRGIDVGTKQEIYQLLRRLADAGNAILLYTTDYDELIGCCDRVVMLYDGRIVRELSGNALTERNIVTSALNLPFDAAAEARP
ncbi:MAG TPA: sugar ABC transporter ATP-binding protein [Candidatus Cybelea sp.]|nr:sugar ABC transporter ATP-binding protein [Candidatus Cybelea sp.]